MVNFFPRKKEMQQLSDKGLEELKKKEDKYNEEYLETISRMMHNIAENKGEKSLKITHGRIREFKRCNDNRDINSILSYIFTWLKDNTDYSVTSEGNKTEGTQSITISWE